MTPIDMFSIREAISSDATAIWQLNCDEMGYQYSLADTRQNIIKLLSSNSNRIYVIILTLFIYSSMKNTQDTSISSVNPAKEGTK